jgi:hypothetical protein
LPDLLKKYIKDNIQIYILRTQLTIKLNELEVLKKEKAKVNIIYLITYLITYLIHLCNKLKNIFMNTNQ